MPKTDNEYYDEFMIMIISIMVLWFLEFYGFDRTARCRVTLNVGVNFEILSLDGEV